MDYPVNGRHSQPSSVRTDEARLSEALDSRFGISREFIRVHKNDFMSTGELCYLKATSVDTYISAIVYALQVIQKTIDILLFFGLDVHWRTMSYCGSIEPLTIIHKDN
jgi:hypothetical protein